MTFLEASNQLAGNHKALIKQIQTLVSTDDHEAAIMEIVSRMTKAELARVLANLQKVYQAYPIP